MFRYTAPIALAAFTALPAYAQTAAPAAKPMPAAEKNALINAELPADQAAMKAHVMFLASDPMKGREAGTNEFDVAAQYVAAQFYAAGLRPAGDENSYLQQVTLLNVKPASKGAMTLNRAKGAAIELEFGKDYVPGMNPAKLDLMLTAPVVFVGYGITGFGRDDYKGVDIKGKIAAFFPGAPGSIPPEERAHLGGAASKGAIAMKKGAVGYITLESPRAGRGSAPFAMAVASWDRPRVTFANPDGTGYNLTAATPGLGMLSKSGAEKLFAGSKANFEAIYKAAANDETKFKPVQLAGTLTASIKTEAKPFISHNVAGMLKGADAKLSDEVVVLTAHLDHVGVGKANALGDTIYNGAMDNAVGIAALIEEAKRFKAAGTPPRRSILFLAVTAEEKGLVGADYFANYPTVPRGNIVANVNLDMPIINYAFEDVVPFGAAHSTLGEIATKAAAEIGVTVSPDSRPEEAFFVRSDHYRFVQKGIPSVFLWPGEKGPGKAAVDAFLANHYHKPSDELVQDPAINWDAGVRFVDVNYRIARAIADADQKPVWKKGNFFGTTFDGPMQK